MRNKYILNSTNIFSRNLSRIANSTPFKLEKLIREKKRKE